MLQQSQQGLRLRHRLKSTRIAGRSLKSTRRNGGRKRGNTQTSKPSQQSRLAMLTSFLADSLVRTFPSLESKPAFATVSAAVSTLNSCALSGIYDHERSSWKTSQISLMPDLTLYLERLPKSAMTVSGRLYELPMLAHRTNANDGFALQFPTARASEFKGGRTLEGLAKARRNWSNGLHDAVTHWATVTADDANNATRASGAFSSLTRDVRTWATPNAADNQGTHGGGQGRSLRTDMQAIRQSGDVLNPDWVELLMGYPVGWTSPVSQVAQTNRNTAMNRLALVRQKRRLSARNGFTRLVTPLYRNKRSRFLMRFTDFYLVNKRGIA